MAKPFPIADASRTSQTRLLLDRGAQEKLGIVNGLHCAQHAPLYARDALWWKALQVQRNCADGRLEMCRMRRQLERGWQHKGTAFEIEAEALAMQQSQGLSSHALVKSP